MRKSPHPRRHGKTRKMGKFIAGLFRLFVTLILLGAIVYLYFEVRRLDGEIAELKRRTPAAVKTSKRDVLPSPASIPVSYDPAGLLSAARGHVEQAETLLRRKDYGGAMRELSAATETARKAGEEAQTRSQKSFVELSKTIASLKEKVETLAGADNEASPRARPGDNR
jgi:hypothetical protein